MLSQILRKEASFCFTIVKVTKKVASTGFDSIQRMTNFQHFQQWQCESPVIGWIGRGEKSASDVRSSVLIDGLNIYLYPIFVHWSMNSTTRRNLNFYVSVKEFRPRAGSFLTWSF